MTRPQKDLLYWHWRLGHASQRRVQGLMRKNPHSGQQIIFPSQKKAASCDPPMCTACRLARGNRNKNHLQPRQPAPDMVIRSNDLNPGDCVSVDQYICHIRGRLPNTHGKEKDVNRYCGGLIAVDHASGYINISHQVSLYGGETLKCKHRFESFLKNFGITVKKYRCDNGIFAKNEWVHDCENQDQKNEYSGVGAHQQNGVAERSIQTIAHWARSMMLHSALHWPDQADIKLWPFAMQHAAFIWNNLPDETSGLAPIEYLTGSRLASYDCLRQLHVWGCAVFVLDPKLQDGKKLPKWKPRSRLGQYLGVAPGYSSSVGYILNLDTGFVSPQYHVVHDDYFTTVPASLAVDSWTALGGIRSWQLLYELGCEKYFDTVDGNSISDDAHGIPPLTHTWESEGEQQQNDSSL